MPLVLSDLIFHVPDDDASGWEPLPDEHVLVITRQLEICIRGWQETNSHKDNDISGLIADEMEENEPEFPTAESRAQWAALKAYMRHLFNNRTEHRTYNSFYRRLKENTSGPADPRPTGN
jgi:hypothetical protein